MKVSIVIPIYKASLSFTEEISLKQCLKLLNEHDIYLCQPDSLDTSFITNQYPEIKTEKFEDIFFKGILGYNKLMLSSIFYERFKTYDYMLIAQLDTYIFKNELTEWCEKGYDYIGAPWLAGKQNIFKQIKTLTLPKIKQERSKVFFKVGNGGLSLRKISSFIDITINYNDVINKELNRDRDNFQLMEDVFWSLKAPKLVNSYKIPHYKEAVLFAIDRRPKIGFKLTKGDFPFGCHGFNKKNVCDFWKGKIPELK